jgi:hypothetical protein
MNTSTLFLEHKKQTAYITVLETVSLLNIMNEVFVLLGFKATSLSGWYLMIPDSTVASHSWVKNFIPFMDILNLKDETSKVSQNARH